MSLVRAIQGPPRFPRRRSAVFSNLITIELDSDASVAGGSDRAIETRTQTDPRRTETSRHSDGPDRAIRNAFSTSGRFSGPDHYWIRHPNKLGQVAPCVPWLTSSAYDQNTLGFFAIDIHIIEMKVSIANDPSPDR